MMKRWIVTGLVVVMVFALSSVSFAGDLGRGRWQGFAFGLGAVTLYNLFEHGKFSPVIPPGHVYKRHGHYHPPVVYEPSGHWEIRKDWVPERRAGVWVPGHYENGYWVKGHHETRVYPGHWVERKAWVEHHYPPEYEDPPEDEYSSRERTRYEAYGTQISVQR